MKKYVDNLEIENFDKVNKEIVNWKKNILKYVDILDHVIKRGVFAIFGIIGLLLFLYMSITLFAAISSNNEEEIKRFEKDYIYFIVALCCIGISIIFLIWCRYDWKKDIRNNLANSEINPYTFWLSEINHNLKVDKDYVPDNSLTKINDYDEMKYIFIGLHSVGLTREYELSRGTIFNNPYELSCGVWQSTVGNGKNHFDYMPLLKIQTNLFLSEKIVITNSNIFGSFSKRDIQLEDDIFNNMFSIMSTDENAVRMILTPVVQNKWKEIKNLPPFNMSIENGFIKILFKPKTSFMDVKSLSNVPLRNIKHLEKIIWEDIATFLNIINLTFSISILQFEEVVNIE